MSIYSISVILKQIRFSNTLYFGYLYTNKKDQLLVYFPLDISNHQIIQFITPPRWEEKFIMQNVIQIIEELIITIYQIAELSEIKDLEKDRLAHMHYLENRAADLRMKAYSLIHDHDPKSFIGIVHHNFFNRFKVFQEIGSELEINKYYSEDFIKGRLQHYYHKYEIVDPVLKTIEIAKPEHLLDANHFDIESFTLTDGDKIVKSFKILDNPFWRKKVSGKRLYDFRSLALKELNKINDLKAIDDSFTQINSSIQKAAKLISRSYKCLA